MYACMHACMCIYMCIYIYTHVYIFVYINIPSPIPATAYQGLVRPHGRQLLEFWPPQAFQNHSNDNEINANARTIHDKSVLGRILVPTWGAAGPKKAPDAKKYKQNTEQFGMVDPPRPQFDDLSMIFSSW